MSKLLDNEYLLPNQHRHIRGLCSFQRWCVLDFYTKYVLACGWCSPGFFVNLCNVVCVCVCVPTPGGINNQWCDLV